MELSKNINADEAAAMGAVYKGADLSTGFKVKKFITKDAALFPIQVVFERDGKQVKRTLFSLMNPYPQKKIITFNKHTDDFSFMINYAELGHLSDEETKRLGSLNLSRVEVQGVTAALSKHNTQAGVESKGIKAHFSMDESGILHLASTEAIFEKITTENEEQDNESPLSKLGSTISKLFTSGDPTPAPENATEKIDQNTENITSTNATATNATKEAPKPKLVIVKEPIVTEETTLSLKFMSQDQYTKSFDKLAALNNHDSIRMRRETALNTLETLVIDARTKLAMEEYSSTATSAEKAKIGQACDEIADWLYEDGSDAETGTYEKKISEMYTLTHDLYARVKEHYERPEVLRALGKMLDGSKVFLDNSLNATKDDPEKKVFTDVEMETLGKVIKETTEWRNKMVAEQDKKKRSEPIILTVKMIAEKMGMLDREVRYLVHKLKLWRPKTVEKPVKEPKETKNSSEKEDNNTKEAKKDETTEDKKENVEPPIENENLEKDDHSEL